MNSRLLGAILGLAMIAGCSQSSNDTGESGLRVELKPLGEIAKTQVRIVAYMTGFGRFATGDNA